MIYQKVLDALVRSRAGLNAALLLDREGETVVAVARSGDPEVHRVLGAYHGIFLRDLARAFGRCALGNIEFFSLDWGMARISTVTLADGFFLMLVAEASVPAGILHHDLARAASDLRDAL